MVSPISGRKENTAVNFAAKVGNPINATSKAMLSLTCELQRQIARFSKTCLRTTHSRIPATAPTSKNAFVALNAVIKNRPEAATDLLRLLAHELAPENYQLARLHSAFKTSDYNRLPESSLLAGELEEICSVDSFPNKQFVLDSLEKLISAFIQPARAKMESGENVPPHQLNQLVNISVVLLKALGKLSDNTVTTIDKLSASHLEQLVTLYNIALQTEQAVDDPTSIASIRNLLHRKREAIVTIQGSPLELENLDEVSRSDRDVVMIAVQLMGWTLSFTSEHLKNDREIVLAAVNQNGWALGFASEEMRNDKAVVMSAVQNTGIALQFASQELRNDRELVIAAVRQNPMSIIHLSPEFQRDPEIRALAFPRPQ